MLPKLSDQFPLKKWLAKWKAQSRNVSVRHVVGSLDRTEDRTDRDVFIRRTLHKWFTGKFFRVEIQGQHPLVNKGVDDWQYPVHTEYWAIVWVSLAYTWIDQVRVTVMLPYSNERKHIYLNANDLMHLGGREDSNGWAIISQFYPTSVVSVPVPSAYFKKVPRKKAKK